MLFHRKGDWKEGKLILCIGHITALLCRSACCMVLAKVSIISIRCSSNTVTTVSAVFPLMVVLVVVIVIIVVTVVFFFVKVLVRRSWMHDEIIRWLRARCWRRSMNLMMIIFIIWNAATVLEWVLHWIIATTSAAATFCIVYKWLMRRWLLTVEFIRVAGVIGQWWKCSGLG